MEDAPVLKRSSGTPRTSVSNAAPGGGSSPATATLVPRRSSSPLNLTLAGVRPDDHLQHVFNPVVCPPQEGDALVGGSDLTLGWFHPAQAAFRRTLLFFLISLSFGVYFVYDQPGALMYYLSRDLDLSPLSFSLLYACYAIPNILLVFFYGHVCDRRLGPRASLVLAAMCVLAGQSLLTLGAHLGLLWVMLIGRAVMGIGAESLAVVQNAIIVSYFEGRELRRIFAAAMAVARTASVVNLSTAGMAADEFGDTGALVIGCAVVGGTAAAAVGVALMDKRAERLIEKRTLSVEEGRGKVRQGTDHLHAKCPDCTLVCGLF